MGLNGNRYRVMINTISEASHKLFSKKFINWDHESRWNHCEMFIRQVCAFEINKARYNYNKNRISMEKFVSTCQTYLPIIEAFEEGGRENLTQYFIVKELFEIQKARTNESLMYSTISFNEVCSNAVLKDTYGLVSTEKILIDNNEKLLDIYNLMSEEKIVALKRIATKIIEDNTATQSK